jgi:Rrf2 family cysteine metabolism transcriptional repressor
MLKLSTKARYGLRSMVELALREGEGLTQLTEVARAQHISPRYLEQLAAPLRNAGLVRSERGPHGGYELAKPAEAITALDIVRAVEGPPDLLDCVATSSVCDRAGACAARNLWKRASEAITGVLAESTLAELRDQQRALRDEQRASGRVAVSHSDYCI